MLKQMQKSYLNNLLFYVIIIFLAVPLITIFGAAFFLNDLTPNEFSFTLEGFKELMSGLRIAEIGKIAFRSLIISLIASVLSFLISYILIFKTRTSFQFVFYLIITLPFLVNESVRVFSWQVILSENGFLNHILNLNFFNGTNPINVYLVMLIACIPFGIFITSASLQTIPPVYWQATNDLKIRPLSKFFKIALPLSKFALFVSFTIIFFIAFAMSSEVNFLGGDSKISIRNLVLSLMSASKFQSIFSLGFLMLTILFLGFMVQKFINRNQVNF